MSGELRVRVLLVGLPSMLRDIVARVLRAQPDIEIMGNLPATDHLDEVTRKDPPDVVLLGGVTAVMPDACKVLLCSAPKAKLVSIESSGRRAFLWALSVQPVELGELSPEELAGAIRQAALRP